MVRLGFFLKIVVASKLLFETKPSKPGTKLMGLGPPLNTGGKWIRPQLISRSEKLSIVRWNVVIDDYNQDWSSIPPEFVKRLFEKIKMNLLVGAATRLKFKSVFLHAHIMNNDFFKIIKLRIRVCRNPESGSLTGIRSWYLLSEIHGTGGKPSVFDHIEKSLNR